MAYSLLIRCLFSLSGEETLLEIADMKSGKAEVGSNTIIESINDWNIPIDSIIGGVFDTTNTNSGGNAGIMVRLDEALGRRVLHLYCRHHVYERYLLL